MSHAKRLILQKPRLASSQFGEDAPSEIVNFGNLEDVLGGHIRARCVLFRAILMASKIIEAQC
eukprot:5222617-Pyramimonas_sp.AAC.1